MAIVQGDFKRDDSMGLSLNEILQSITGSKEGAEQIKNAGKALITSKGTELLANSISSDTEKMLSEKITRATDDTFEKYKPLIIGAGVFMGVSLLALIGFNVYNSLQAKKYAAGK